MHPVIYSEFKQSIREYKSILFLITVLIACRVAFGDYGHLINLFIFFPIIAGSLGTGLLFQEYSKNYMKYLYTLPIKRWHLILIKMINSVLAALLFLLIIYIIKWLIPPRFVLPVAFFSAFFDLTPLIIFSMIIAVFNFGVCIFSITFLRSPKMAGSLNYVLLIVALLYLGYCFLDTGYKYRTSDYMLIFIPPSLLLTVGGMYLFTLRNPFLNRNPRHLLTGLLLAVISTAYFAGSTRAITYGMIRNPFKNRPIEQEPVFDKGVINYSISPDGEFVFIETSTAGFVYHSGVFDASGKLVVDLGKHSSIFDYSLLWQFNHGRRIVMYCIEKPLLSELISRKKFVRYFARDLDSQQQYTFKETSDRYMGRFDDYEVLNCNTMEMYGIGLEEDIKNSKHLFVLKQNLLTDAVTKIPIPGSMEVWPYEVEFIGIERIAFVAPPGEDESDDKGRYRFVVFHINEQRTEQTFLPKSAANDQEIFGDRCYFHEKMSDDNGFCYRVGFCSAGKKEQTLLAPEQLPRISYRQAAQGTAWAGISLDTLRSPWLECRYRDPNAQPHLMLINREGERVYADPTIGNFVFAPGQTRFYARKSYYMDMPDPNQMDEMGIPGMRPSLTIQDLTEPEKDLLYIYDIVGRQAVLIKEFEVEAHCSQIHFLNDNTLIYIKDPTPDEEWANNRYLMKHDLETMQSTPFISQ